MIYIQGLSDVVYVGKNVIDLEKDFIKKQIGNEAPLEEFRIALVHMSYDKQTNNYGYRLAELCSNLLVLVANGRYKMFV